MSVAASVEVITIKIIACFKSNISSGYPVLSEFITMLPKANMRRPY